MKKTFLLMITQSLFIITLAQSGSVGIGTTNPNNSAALEIQSTTKGVLIPRLTTVQRNAISSPATGLLVYDNTTNSFWFKSAADWVELSDTANNVWKKNGAIAYTGATLVGVGTSTPAFHLDVNGSSRITQDHTVNRDAYINRDLWVDRNLDVDGTSNLFGNIIAGSNLSVSGNVTVDAGKGIVRGNASQQLVVIFPSGSVGLTNAPPGHTQDVDFSLSNVFAGTPLVSVAQVLNQSGNFEQWTTTIHSVDIVNHRFTVRFYNASNTNSTFTATYRFIAIGAAL